MFKKILSVLILAAASLVHAQQPQTQDIPPTQPIFATNAKYVNGVAPGFLADNFSNNGVDVEYQRRNF